MSKYDLKCKMLLELYRRGINPVGYETWSFFNLDIIESVLKEMSLNDDLSLLELTEN